METIDWWDTSHPPATFILRSPASLAHCPTPTRLNVAYPRRFRVRLLAANSFADGSIYRLPADLRAPDQAQLYPDAAILAHALGQERIVQLDGRAERQVEYRLGTLVRDGQLRLLD